MCVAEGALLTREASSSKRAPIHTCIACARVQGLVVQQSPLSLLGLELPLSLLAWVLDLDLAPLDGGCARLALLTLALNLLEKVGLAAAGRLCLL